MKTFSLGQAQSTIVIGMITNMKKKYQSYFLWVMRKPWSQKEQIQGFNCVYLDYC
jgi:hypothetical protein